jgi:hypothetical protein
MLATSEARPVPAQTARYVRLEALSAVGGATAMAGQFDCGGTDRRPRPA